MKTKTESISHDKFLKFIFYINFKVIISENVRFCIYLLF